MRKRFEISATHKEERGLANLTLIVHTEVNPVKEKYQVTNLTSKTGKRTKTCLRCKE